MRVFNSLTQLSQAHLTNGMLVEVPGTPTLRGTVVSTGQGLILASGNVFQPNTEDYSLIFGRRVIPLMAGMDLSSGVIIFDQAGNLYQYNGVSTATLNGGTLSVMGATSVITDEGNIPVTTISGLDEVLTPDEVPTALTGRVDMSSLKDNLRNALRNTSSLLDLTSPVNPVAYTSSIALTTPIIHSVSNYRIRVELSTTKGEASILITKASAGTNGVDTVFYIEQNGDFNITCEAVLVGSAICANISVDAPGVASIVRATAVGSSLSNTYTGWDLSANTTVPGSVNTSVEVYGINPTTNAPVDLAEIISTDVTGKIASADAVLSVYDMISRYRGRSNVTTSNFNLDTIWGNEDYNGIFICTNGVTYTAQNGSAASTLSGQVVVENYVEANTGYRVQRITKLSSATPGNMVIRVSVTSSVWYTIRLVASTDSITPSSSGVAISATRTTTGTIQEWKNSGGTNVMTVSTSGVLSTSGNITGLSDARLKENVVTVDNALDKVSAMRGVYFDKDGKRNIGVIAQEVLKVIPEAVHEDEYYSVAYGNLVGLLIEAIKELKEQVCSLKQGV